jgi:Zn-dependent M28 family amino/carboxypeptidase
MFGMQTTMSRFHRMIAPLALLGLGVGVVVPAAGANDSTSTRGFRKAVTFAGIREHQQAFQKHSDDNGGNRVAGGAGYEASANYVVAKMQAAGYNVSSQNFQFQFNSDRTPPVFQQLAPQVVNYVDGVDFASMTYSGNGDVTASVHAVNLTIPPSAIAGTAPSGCVAADFAGFPAGSIALVQRGTCNFSVKALNAQAAGAAAVIVMNEGQPGRTGPVGGTLGTPDLVTIPVIGSTYASGTVLMNGVLNGPTGAIVRVRVDRLAETRTTRNIIAETPGGDPNNVVVIGAHLDSVSRGPGINDNGSGSAAILEVAEVLATQQDPRELRNKLRFVWWGAEELGLLGSNYYVSQLNNDARSKIRLNLNFDMIGSPNYVRFVYDGDNSAFPVGPNAAAGPQGSGEIERVFHDYFGSQGLASAETPFSGRSDYGPFIAVGIPAGGLFTGAEGIKTPEQAAIFGGTAGQQYDPCYHLACDTFANVNTTGLDQMSDAVAHSVLYFSKRDFAKQPLINPTKPVSGVTGTAGGGGLHDDHDHEPDFE